MELNNEGPAIKERANPFASKCVDGGPHEWEEIARPRNHESGWHIDKCKKCGKVAEYDTSD